MADTVWKVIFRGTDGGHQILNVLHVATSDSLSGAPGASTLADTIWSNCGTQYLACCRTEMSVQSLDVVEVLDPYQVGGNPPAGSHAVNASGTLSGLDAKEGYGVCAMIRFRTDRSGRSARGRMFLPPFKNSAYMADGFLLATSGAYKTAVDAFRTKLADSLGPSSIWTTPWNDWDGRFIVYSRTLHQRDAPNWWFDIKSFVTDLNLHYLRSRVTAP